MTEQEQNHPEEYALSPKKTLTTIGGILGFSLLCIALIVFFKPEASKKPQRPDIVTVETVAAKIQDYPIKLLSNGNIQATTNTTLVAQVSGEITSINPNFADGGSFKKGDVLLTIDQRNYAAAVSNAKANLSQARANYAAEKANAAQAEKDWQRLGFEGEPNDRVLRKPQLAAASGQLKAAKASLKIAELDFEKTNIRAPYDGFVINRTVGLGEFVNLGKALGSIFSTQGLEVALPLNQQQYAQLDQNSNAQVTIFSELSGTRHNWPAKLIRVGQSFNTNTRQIDAAAQVENTLSDQGLELKIGQYVKAEIIARTIKDAVLIPNKAVRENRYIFLFEDGALKQYDINTIWQDDANTIVSELPANAKVVITSLNGAVTGTKAKLAGEQNTEKPNRTDKTVSEAQTK